MKKLISLILLICLLIPCLIGCGREGDAMRVVVTAYAPYDLLTQIVGDSDIEVIFLSEDGADPHSFQPTAEDFVNIYTADLFIYLDEQAESWCADAVKRCHESGGRTLALVDSAIEHEHEHEHEGHDHGADEHVWLSPILAKRMSTAMAEELCEIDKDNADNYRKNLDKVLHDLDTLDEGYRQTVDDSAKNKVVVADRFPFTYLFEEYGIDYLAAFPGCSAESEASFDTVVGLINAVRDEGLSYILIIETSDGALANTVAKESGSEREVLTLYSIQVKSDKGYFDLMNENLEVLRKALG